MDARVLLILMIPQGHCTQSNVDTADARVFEMRSMQDCEERAATIDVAPNVRAVCVQLDKTP